MKKIWMDFNEPDMKNFRITKQESKDFDLKVGERILLYCEDVQVEAVVGYDNNEDRWFGIIDSDFTDIPNEIAEARHEGFINGYFFGLSQERYKIIRYLEELNVTKDLINAIINLPKVDVNWFNGQLETQKEG